MAHYQATTKYLHVGSKIFSQEKLVLAPELVTKGPDLESMAEWKEKVCLGGSVN